MQNAEETPIVLGDEIEPDESRTHAEFADDELMTPEQVAHRFHCSAIQVREWISTGMLTPVRDGSIERIRRSEVERIGNPDDEAAKAFEGEHSEGEHNA